MRRIILTVAALAAVPLSSGCRGGVTVIENPKEVIGTWIDPTGRNVYLMGIEHRDAVASDGRKLQVYRMDRCMIVFPTNGGQPAPEIRDRVWGVRTETGRVYDGPRQLLIWVPSHDVEERYDIVSVTDDTMVLRTTDDSRRELKWIKAN